MIANILPVDYSSILSGNELTKAKLQQVINSLIQLTDVIEGSGVPTIAAEKHSWYFDITASKYYRNTDGGTTWVALN